MTPYFMFSSMKLRYLLLVVSGHCGTFTRGTHWFGGAVRNLYFQIGDQSTSKATAICSNNGVWLRNMSINISHFAGWKFELPKGVLTSYWVLIIIIQWEVSATSGTELPSCLLRADAHSCMILQKRKSILPESELFYTIPTKCDVAPNYCM